MEMIRAQHSDIPELFAMQKIAFLSEARMIGSDDVPALRESREHHLEDFNHWENWKLMTEERGKPEIAGFIRCREIAPGILDIGRLMVNPAFRRRGLAMSMLEQLDQRYPALKKELYTCEKSWSNIILYEKASYRIVDRFEDDAGLVCVRMEKNARAGSA